MKKFLLLILTMFLISKCALSQEPLSNIFIEDPQNAYELHGYLEYDEILEPVEQEAVYLDDNISKTTVRISNPHKVGSKSLMQYSNAKVPQLDPNLYKNSSKYGSQEYSIAPTNAMMAEKTGSFSFGTLYSSSIDTAQLENSTKFFTRYDSKYFAVSGAFGKTAKTNYGGYNDAFYLAPELKLGKTFAVQSVLKSDISSQKQTSEVVLLYRPQVKKYAEGVQFELGAGQTFYQNSDTKSTLRFSTRFKL